MSGQGDFNCTWEDYGTARNVDLLWLTVMQAGAVIRAAISVEQWSAINDAIEKNLSFRIHMQADQQRMGVIFVAVPTRGGLYVEVVAIPRVKATGCQMVDGADARSKPRPEIRVLPE